MTYQKPPQDTLFRITIEALNFIEDNLTESISVKNVTDRFEKSHWQFQRLFASVIGVTIGQYLRERRLTEASLLLRQKNHRIIDLAMLYDFGSEEAFSRSFKSFFEITPKAYRSNHDHVLLKARNKIDQEKLAFFWHNVQRTPSIIRMSAKYLIGTSIDFKSHFILGSECHAKIVPHWANFKKQMPLVQNRLSNERIGVVLSSELELRQERLTYFSGVEVIPDQQPLKGMHSVLLPEGLYACFEHQTLSQKNGHLIDYIYGIWLPSSNYERGQGFDYEIFDENYVAYDPTSVSTFYVPIKKKH